MTRSVNKVIVLGHLGRDAETNFTPSGVAVTKFSVATSRRWKDSQSEEWKEETDWHNFVLWRSENLANYLTKGKQVYVEGRLQTRSYADRDGAKRYVTEIVADVVILLGGQQGGSQDQQELGKSNNGLVSQPRGRETKEEPMANLERNKQTVVDFFTRAFNDHEPADAVAKYVGSRYIQHNPDTPDGAAAFVESTKNLIARNPELGVEIKRVIAEDDLVVTHDLVKSSPNQRGMAGIDIFRLEDGKIVEHWDVRQPVPEKAGSGNTMF